MWYKERCHGRVGNGEQPQEPRLATIAAGGGGRAALRNSSGRSAPAGAAPSSHRAAAETDTLGGGSSGRQPCLWQLSVDAQLAGIPGRRHNHNHDGTAGADQPAHCGGGGGRGSRDNRDSRDSTRCVGAAAVAPPPPPSGLAVAGGCSATVVTSVVVHYPAPREPQGPAPCQEALLALRSAAGGGAVTVLEPLEAALHRLRCGYDGAAAPVSVPLRTVADQTERSIRQSDSTRGQHSGLASVSDSVAYKRKPSRPLGDDAHRRLLAPGAAGKRTAGDLHAG